MTRSVVKDKLRAEYFDLLPDMRSVTEELETRIRYAVLPHLVGRDKYELINITSRVKECESAIGSMERRQEGRYFDESLVDQYTLTSLKDLAGVRILVFPNSKLADLDEALRQTFCEWTSDPIYHSDDSQQLLAHKYYGRCESSSRVMGEYQIVPMLIGLFWEVEHTAIYKPVPRLKGIARSLEMQEKKEVVYSALKAFAEEFENLLGQE